MANENRDLFASAAASARFARRCLEPYHGHRRAISSFVTPEAAIMHWHDFGDLEGPGWAANAVGGAHLLYRWGVYTGDEALRDDALALLDHVLEDGFIDRESGFIWPYYELAQARFCLNYVHRNDWFCPGSLARVGAQLLDFAADLGDNVRAPRMVEAATRLGEWLYDHVRPLPNGWVPRRVTPDGAAYGLTPEGRPDPIFDHSSDGLFLLDLYAALAARAPGRRDYAGAARALGDAFVAAGGFWGSMNHDTYDDHENVAYAVAFRSLRRAAALCGRPAWVEFAYAATLPALAAYQMAEDRHGVATTGLLWMEESWNTAYLWENAEIALAFLEAWQERGDTSYRERALAILHGISRHHYGAEGFLSEGIDWDNHVSQRHHVREALYGAIRYTEPLLNNLHLLAPTLYYFNATGQRPPAAIDAETAAARAAEISAQAGPPIGGRDGARYLIRLYHPALSTDARVEQALRFVRAAGADGVMLFEASFDMDPALLTLDALRARFARIQEVVPRFRAAGQEVHIDVMITMGHVDAGCARPERFPFQFQVDEAGRVSRSSACPLDPAYLDYVAELYRLAAQCGADAIWVDDDVRYVGHDVPGLTCFCPRHLAALSQRTGREWTRGELAAALREGRDSTLAAAWFDAQDEGMLKLARTVESAVHSVAPETRIGLMTIGTAFHAAEGRRTDALLRAYAGPTRPMIRPGSGYYSDWTPGGVIDKSEDCARQMVWVSEDVQGVAEVETYPYTPFAKSLRGLGIELALDVLAGMPDLSLNLLTTMEGSGPLEPEGSAYAPWLAAQRPFLDALARARAGMIRRGVGIADSEDYARHARPEGDSLMGWIERRPWEHMLARLGIPAGRPYAAPHWIAGQAVAALSDYELNLALREGAVLDPVAAQWLLEHGWGPRLGLSAVRPVRDGANEVLTDDPLTGGRGGQMLPAYNTVPDALYAYDVAAAARVLSRWVNVDSEERGAATVALVTPEGRRVGLLPFALAAPAFALVNVPHRALWAGLLAWAAGRDLPCRVVNGVNLYPLAFEAPDGREWLVAVVNLTADEALGAELALGLDGAGWRVERLRADGQWEPLGDQPGHGILRLDIPAFTLAAYRLTAKA